MTDIQRAFDIRQNIIAQKHAIQAGFVTLGELFSEVIDKSLWKLSGCDSFAAFCADPEIGFSEKTAYQYAGLYKFWCLDCGIDRDKLIRIGPSNLEIIKHRFGETKDMELLDDAEHLSRSDLLEKMGRARKEGKRGPSKQEQDYRAGAGAGTMEEWKKRAGCCVCGDDATEKSHFPRTAGAGALEYMWAPMCRSCHSQLHQVGVDTFLEKYKIPIFIWFYNGLEDLFGRIK